MLTRDMAGKREGNLEEDGVGGAVGHAELAQLEGGAQVGGKEARAEHRRLVRIQVPGRIILIGLQIIQ